MREKSCFAGFAGTRSIPRLLAGSFAILNKHIFVVLPELRSDFLLRKDIRYRFTTASGLHTRSLKNHRSG